jgi:hypothetical protein
LSVEELAGFVFKGHAGEEVFDSVVDAEGGVLVGVDCRLIVIVGGSELEKGGFADAGEA